MKAKFLKAALGIAAVALVAFASVNVHAQNRKLDFTLVNQTGVDIAEVYVTPTNDDSWGEDVMGKDILKNKASVDITFSRKETTCNWDLKVIDVEKDSIEWTKLDLCKANEITLKYEGKHPTAIIK